MILLSLLIIGLLAFSSVSAGDVNETVVASENQNSDLIEIDDENANDFAVEEQEIYNIGATEENELSATQGSFTDLYNDIVNANGELNLTRNYVYDSSRDSNYVNGITINKQITINGKGFVINGNEQARAFDVTQSNVTLRNIQFKNCYNSNIGGAINWDGNNGRVFDCNFVNCHTPLSGGAIYWKGNYGKLFDCDFIDCYSNYGGAVFWEGTNGNLSNSYFKNCYCYSLANITASKTTSSTSSGGAIYWKGDNGNLINSTFEQCKCSNYVYVSFSTTNTGTVTSTSNSFGGAISWYGENGNLTNCIFDNSQVTSSSYINSYGYSTSSNTNSYSRCYGGTVYWNGKNGNIIDCDFRLSQGSSYSYGYSGRRIGNSYGYSYGGAIFWNGDDGNLINCKFNNAHIYSNSYCSSDGTKSSYAYGGAIYWHGDGGEIYNCKFNRFSISASTTSSGKAIYWYGNEGDMFNCSFNGTYYNYLEVCNAEKNVYPVLLIHTSDLYDDERFVICEITPLIKNVTASIYDVTNKITLYKQFSMSSEDLTTSFTVNDLPEGEYQLVLEYAGDSFYTATSANNLFKIGKNSSQEVTISGGVIEGDNATINVTLNEDATGRVKLTLANYTFIQELVDGKTSFYIPYLKGGINTYKIKYEGDNKYNPIYITNTIKVLYKSNIKLNLKENIVFDENIPLTYTLTPKSAGNLSVFVDNIFKANISVNDAFELENISVGDHNITVIYNGNEYYSSCRDSTSFTVSKANPSIKINSSDLAGNVIFEVVLNKKATGNVTITLNNNSYSQNLTDGKTNITIPNLVADSYNCVINYEGDSNYNPLTQNYDFTLKLKKSNINIDVIDIKYGDIADVQFNLTTDATGTISVYLNNSFIKNISIGEKINLPDLSVDKYLVKLVYSGNGYYESCENTTTFNVLKIKPTIDLISVSSTSENITYGDIVDISYHITNGVTGTVSIYIDSVLNKTVNIGDSVQIDNLNAGTHNVKLVYNGDKNYSTCDKELTFEVLKKNIDISTAVKIIDMVYGKTKISFTTSFDGVLNINASNKYHKSFTIQSNINNDLNLTDMDAGDYDMEYVFVPNNQNYNKATITNTLTIFKAEPTFNIVVNDVNYKELTNLNINYLNDITGFANITISNDNGFEIKYSNVDLSEGKFNKVLSNLNASKYTVTLEYSGNNNYYPTTQLKTFNVFKIDPTMMVEVTNATYGQTAKITANCNAEGNITITVGSVKTYPELIITDKKVSQNVNDIDAGTYDVSVTYNGNNNYNTKTVNTKLTIYKVSTTVIATADDITYSQTAVVNVKASVNGEVTVKIDNTYINNTNVVANTVTPITFNNIPAGPHNISVVLTPSNKNYNESLYNTEFTVSKKQTSITLGVENSVYGEEVIINVTASEDGKITLKVGDITRERNVLADTMVKINFGILAADSYNVETTFNAGENYKPSNKQTTLVVSPAKAEITSIQAQNNTYGENITINVRTNVEGILTVKINEDSTKTFDIYSNVLTTLDLGKYDVNNYNIDLSFDAGSNYTQATGNAKVTVNPKQTTVELDVDNSIYGKNVIVNVSASENGKITVNVGTNIRTVDVEANKVVSVDFGILDAKSYAVNAAFNGGNNYEKSFDDTSLVISPAQSKITEIQALDKIYGENIIVNVKTNVDGSLTAKIGNITKVIDVTANQIMPINFGVLDVNGYDITLNLNAGSNYVSDNNSTKISVSPKQTDLTLIVKEYESTENVIVNVTATENGKVTIKCNNLVKTADITANNVVSFDFGVLPIGSYEVIANFAAGNNYIDSSASTTFKVLSKINDDDISISVPDIKDGQANNIAIRLPGDATGTVNLTIGKDTYTFDVINGVANVKVPELTEGNYNFTITYSGDNKYSLFSRTGSLTVNKQTTPTKPVAKTTITLKTVKVKKSAKKLVLQATLKQGKTPLKNKKITFKFNGKTYKAKTNKKGIAKIIIKNSVLKKLKVGKKIKYQASYGKILAKKTAKVRK